jgi:galactokinase
MSFEERVKAVIAAHAKRTGVEPAAVYQAPGRVNLLGEHTDYSGGFCMPAALSFNTVVAASPLADSLLRVRSLDFEETVEIAFDELVPPGKKHWSAYPFGVAWSLQQAGVRLKGAELTMQGNVPNGSGLSSSASVEVATATALLGVARAELAKAQVALACQKAENVYVGAPCGIMDQYISAAGVAGHALALDTRALTAELAPIPSSLRLVVANSMVRHSVGGGEYGERRREVEEAAQACGVKELRDATLADLQAHRGQMSVEAFKRGRHVITDSQRVLDGLAALRAGDAEAFGRLMSAAHVSYRDDFEASCERCDLLVELAMELDGCLGSRLTGGGFGGCTVSLVEAGAADKFAADLQARYKDKTGVTGDVFVCETADGAGLATVIA